MAKKTSTHSASQEMSMEALYQALQIRQIELEAQNEELRKAQLQLTEVHNRYLEHYEYAPVAYLTVDQSGVIYEANLKVEELLNTQRADIIGQPLIRFIAPEDHDIYNLYRQCLLDAPQRQLPELKLTIDGHSSKFVRIESTIHMHPDTHKPIFHFVLIDITEQKKTQALEKINNGLKSTVINRSAEIKQHRDLLSAILNTAADAIIIIDGQHDIESTNPATQTMFGYSEQELIGNNISTVVPSSFLNTLIWQSKNLVEARKNRITDCSKDIIAKHKNGYFIPVSLLVTQVDHTPRYTLIIRNASERVNVQKKILNSVEDERNRISRDLHDSIGQQIVGTAMKLQSVKQTLTWSNRFDQPS